MDKNSAWHGYNFAIHVGKAMRELRELEAGRFGSPDGALAVALREVDNLTPLLYQVWDIRAKLALAIERARRHEYTLSRLALEDANDMVAMSLQR